MPKKLKGFTLVELLAVIVVLGLILLIAVPQVMNVINDSKKGVLASSARLIANSAENIKLSNDTMGINTELQCPDVSKISADDYEDCTIEFVNGEALVTIIGKGRYEGLSVCGATGETAEVVEGNCKTGSGGSSGGGTESGGGSGESTDSECFTYVDVSDGALGVQGISITDYSDTCTKDVVIPSKIDNKTVITIGEEAFYFSKITSVTIPNSVTSIGEEAFQANQLTSVTIPSSVTSIGTAAFNNNKLEDEYAYIYKRNSDGSIDNTHVVSYGGISKDIVIPSNITTIGRSAFEYNGLTSVTIPSSVTSIDSWAFSSNNLTSVTIPSSVTSIGGYAFYKSSYSNPNLTSIINTTGRNFDWKYIITGSSGTSSITGNYNGVNVTTE